MRKCIKIDAHKRDCYYVEIDDDIHSILKQIGCEIFACVGVPLPGKGDQLYIDDMGRLNGTSVGFRIYPGVDIFGNGLICGNDGEGNPQDVLTDLDYVKHCVQFGISAFQ